MPRIPVLIPRVADAETILPYLREIDRSRTYSNHGPQERALKACFAQALGGRSLDEISLFSSGTAALVAALQAWRLPAGSRCLVPSWTFVGSACAVAQAGLEPVIVDVDAERWSLQPAEIERLARRHAASAALVVAPFGASLAYDELCEVQARTGLRILIDGAAAYDYVERLAGDGRALDVPVMISLHATKLVSAIEGGLIVSSDTAAIQSMIAWSNFGIFDTEPVARIGTNAKLSEVHAAYGKVSLSLWPEQRSSLAGLAEAYVERIGAMMPECRFAPNISEGLVSSTFNVMLPGPAEAYEAALERAGIQTRRWWKGGVHRFPAFARFAPDPLPVTDALAAATVGLPFHHEMNETEIERVAHELAEVCAAVR